MRYVVVGLGNIGQRRRALLGDRCVATADPFNDTADFRSARDCPVDTYDAAVLAIPDDDKLDLIAYLLEHGKHVLVEKPLPLPDEATARRLTALAAARGLALYTAYNHRFEPLLAAFKERLDAGAIGEVYHGRLFYGNGTVRHVAGTWRDQGLGAIQDLGCHLLDLLAFVGLVQVEPLTPQPPLPRAPLTPRRPLPRAPLTPQPPLPHAPLTPQPPLPHAGEGEPAGIFSPSPSEGGGGWGEGASQDMRLVVAQSIEANAPDRAVIASADGRFMLEMTYHSWRNSFAFELFGHDGSIHCLGLRKWGGSELVVRRRVFPSGRPAEERWTDDGPDETWEREIEQFERRCAAGTTDLSTDWWIARTLRALEIELAPPLPRTGRGGWGVRASRGTAAEG